MPAQTKTKNLKLNQWQENEYPQMIDFNDDNQKIDDAFGNIEQKVTEGVENFDVSEKQVEFVDLQERTLPTTKDTLKTVVAKVVKYLKDLKTVAFTGKYSDLTGVPTSFPPSAHNHDDRYLRISAKADSAKLADNCKKLEGHPSSYFATAQQLEEVFQSSVDGKTSHISAIDKILGSSSGLTIQSTWNDIKFWWENKVSLANFAKKEILVNRILDNVTSKNISKELPDAKLYKKITSSIEDEFEIYRGTARVVILFCKKGSSYDGASIRYIYLKTALNENLDISAYSRIYLNVFNGIVFKLYDRIVSTSGNEYFKLTYDKDHSVFNSNTIVFINNTDKVMNLYGYKLQKQNDGVFLVYTLDKI